MAILNDLKKSKSDSIRAPKYAPKKGPTITPNGGKIKIPHKIPSTTPKVEDLPPPKYFTE